MLGLSPGLNAYIIFISALLGLVFGSFINSVAWRMVQGGSALKGRSRCTACGHVLSARELIPLFSWLLQKGRCRWCGEKISPRYLITELLSAALFVSAVLRFDVSIEALRAVILACILLGIALTDVDSGMIFDRFILAGIANFLIFNFLLEEPVWRGLFRGFIGGAAIAVPLLVVVLLTDRLSGRESMGGGDIKLIFMLGLYLGWKASLLALIMACVIGLVFALAYKKSGKNPASENGPGAFPFGPSICIAGWLALLFGEGILDWYMGLYL